MHAIPSLAARSAALAAMFTILSACGAREIVPTGAHDGGYDDAVRTDAVVRDSIGPLDGAAADASASDEHEEISVSDSGLVYTDAVDNIEASHIASAPIQVSAGLDVTFAVASDGRVYHWGDYRFFVDQSAWPAYDDTPRIVPGVANALEVAGSRLGACARLADDSVECWGGLAECSPDGVAGSFPPTRLSELSNITQIGVSIGDSTSDSYIGEHACALDSAGAVWCWGANTRGQVSPSAAWTCVRPTLVMTGARQIAVGGDLSCALMLDGSLRCWGVGQPPALHTGDVAEVSAGNSPSICVRYTDGSVWCWVHSFYQSAWAQVAELQNAIALSIGGDHACAIVVGGAVQCWGANDTGQIGVAPSADYVSSAVTVEGLRRAVSLSAGAGFSCAVLGDNTAWCWGTGSYGELGNAAMADSFRPVQVAW
jgi:alpha-tubulin suppressor-like RCC1 family protein